MSVDIMAGINSIPYQNVNIMRALREEAVKALGQARWDEITDGIEIPADGMEENRLNGIMRIFLRRFDEMVEPQVRREIFCRVRHGLKPDDFGWARAKFLEYNDIDKFCADMRSETLDGFAKSVESGEDFHGQPVDKSVYDFVLSQPFLLYGARDGNKIAAVAIPCETMEYLKEKDPKKKRYYACHCRFARRSILQEEGGVSKTICHCSLGHTKIFWEAALGAELEGEIESSALNGDYLCKFIIRLPDEIMQKYVSRGQNL